MGFSRQEYWRGLPFPSPGNLPNPGMEPRSPVLQENSLPSEPPRKVKVKVKSLSVQLFATPWIVVYQASSSLGFSRQGYLSGLLFPSPGDLPDPGTKPRVPALQADTSPAEPPGKPRPPGKTTKGKVRSLSRVRLPATPWTVAYQVFHPWDFPGTSTGVGCHCLLQGIFLPQGSNPGLTTKTNPNITCLGQYSLRNNEESSYCWINLYCLSCSYY